MVAKMTLKRKKRTRQNRDRRSGIKKWKINGKKIYEYSKVNKFKFNWYNIYGTPSKYEKNA